MDTKVSRTLRINLNAVKRLIREHSSYESELSEAQAQISQSTFEPGTSEYKRLLDIRGEAEQMVQDCSRRLEEFMGKLRASLNEAAAFPEDPLVVEARAIIQ